MLEHSKTAPSVVLWSAFSVRVPQELYFPPFSLPRSQQIGELN